MTNNIKKKKEKTETNLSRPEEMLQITPKFRF